MRLLKEHLGLYTDYYELTMAQGYFHLGKHESPAVFDYFFRKLPFKGGYVISCGLSELLECLEEFAYDDKSLKFLRKIGFRDDFLDYLEGFRFGASVKSVKEGEVVFPNEPVLVVEGGMAACQLVETIVLNALNYPSLIATKAARINEVCDGRTFVDFGMRRAHGTSALMGSRASFVGGANATSNVLAGYMYDMPLSGTQAHSWIQSFDDELAAFRSFVESHPEGAILLVDTYNTLKSGVPNAIIIAKEMQAKGNQLYGIRLDSGDLAYLSKKARDQLDEAGLEDVKIIASNQLDEYIIKSLIEQSAPIDAFGIGTRLITGMPDASLDGVYKLTRAHDKDRLKISENIEKITLPGEKNLYRMLDASGKFVVDVISIKGEEKLDKIYHPYLERKSTDVSGMEKESLLEYVMKNGETSLQKKHITEIAEYAKSRLSRLPDEHKRFENPHVYRVGITAKLKEKRAKLIGAYS